MKKKHSVFHSQNKAVKLIMSLSDFSYTVILAKNLTKRIVKFF